MNGRKGDTTKNGKNHFSWFFVCPFFPTSLSLRLHLFHTHIFSDSDCLSSISTIINIISQHYYLPVQDVLCLQLHTLSAKEGRESILSRIKSSWRHFNEMRGGGGIIFLPLPFSALLFRIDESSSFLKKMSCEEEESRNGLLPSARC